MPELTNQEERHAEVAMLSHEVYRLTKQLEEQEQKRIRDAMPDKYDPFDNPTEYKGFSGDYSKILPRITEPGYEIPLDPDPTERKSIRKYYSIGGWCMIFQFVEVYGISYLLLSLILMLLGIRNPDTDNSSLYDYMKGSSIIVALNMVLYLVFNVVNAAIGLKWAGIKTPLLIRTRDFSFGKAVKYCLIALTLWTVSIYAAAGINDVFTRYGFDTFVNSEGIGETVLGTVIVTIYTCIIAPITEEIFYRGMILRVMSKANQRFAIFISAVFFGLGHGNIPQFVLAFLLGIFLAHITMKHGSIIPSIIVHMFVNTFSTVFSKIAASSDQAAIIATLILIAGAILGLFMLLVFRGEDKLPSATPKQSRRGLSVAIGSVPLIGTVIIYLLDMLYVLFSN